VSQVAHVAQIAEAAQIGQVVQVAQIAQVVQSAPLPVLPFLVPEAVAAPSYTKHSSDAADLTAPIQLFWANAFEHWTKMMPGVGSAPAIVPAE
jgi:hypothetical protein